VEQNLEKVKSEFDVIIKCFINILCFFCWYRKTESHAYIARVFWIAERNLISIVHLKLIVAMNVSMKHY